MVSNEIFLHCLFECTIQLVFEPTSSFFIWGETCLSSYFSSFKVRVLYGWHSPISSDNALWLYLDTLGLNSQQWVSLHAHDLHPIFCFLSASSHMISFGSLFLSCIANSQAAVFPWYFGQPAFGRENCISPASRAERDLLRGITSHLWSYYVNQRVLGKKLCLQRWLTECQWWGEVGMLQVQRLIISSLANFSLLKNQSLLTSLLKVTSCD